MNLLFLSIYLFTILFINLFINNKYNNNNFNQQYYITLSISLLVLNIIYRITIIKISNKSIKPIKIIKETIKRTLFIIATNFIINNSSDIYIINNNLDIIKNTTNNNNISVSILSITPFIIYKLIFTPDFLY